MESALLMQQIGVSNPCQRLRVTVAKKHIPVLKLSEPKEH